MILFRREPFISSISSSPETPGRLRGTKDAGRLPMAPDVAALKTGQDLLGRLDDLEVLLGWGRDVQAALS
jgi:hypothetical protein